MGRKNLVYNFKPIEAGDMTLASITGKETDVAQMDSVTYEFSWSGGNTQNGDISVEYSRDTKEPKTWKALDFGATIDTNGASGAHRLIITEIGFQFVRPVYDRTNVAATGTMEVSLFATNKGA